MHRRSTIVSHDTSSSSSNHAPAMAKAPPQQQQQQQQQVRRRKIRRRLSKTEMDDIRSLVLVALFVVVLTASVVWLATGLYNLAMSRQEGVDKELDLGHGRHHHMHHGHESSLQADSSADDDYDVMPWNDIYRIPEAMEIVGDRSNEYARLRLEIDQALPIDKKRSLQRVQDLTAQYESIGTMAMGAHHSDQIREMYDIYNCPDEPPLGYPFEWKLVDEVLDNWPVNDIEHVPSKVHQGLCVFDFEKDYEKAVRYRKDELPFVVVNDPNVARTVERWSIPGYLSEMLGRNVEHRAQYNTNNHFMYSTGKKRKDRVRRRHRRQEEESDSPIVDREGRVAQAQRDDIKPQDIRMTYDDWLVKANKTHIDAEDDHFYFRLIACGFMGPDGSCDRGSSEYIYDELPFFQPRTDNRNELYLGNPKEQMGIHCRFGMKGVIAENHFDAGRNSIAILGGRRRYILSHPKHCSNLSLFPLGHESARHSQVDYTNPDVERFPEFAKNALANEVVLEAGQVLYLPTYWFHFIVSLDLNFQCNTRSGNTDHYNKPIHDCGFKTGPMNTQKFHH